MENNEEKLDEQSQKTLDTILATPTVEELTDFQRGFLRARWHYVKSRNDRNKFKAVFDDKPKEPSTSSEQVEEDDGDLE